MYNDSIETLLLRHYGQNGPTPDALEQRLIHSIRDDAKTRLQEERVATHVLTHPMSRRYAVKLVAVGSAGLGLLGASLEVLDATIWGRNATRSALN